MTIEQLIVDYERVREILDSQIAYLEGGNQIHVPGQDSAKVTDAWLKKLRRFRSEYGSIIAELRRQSAHA